MPAPGLLADFAAELALLRSTHDKTIALQASGHLDAADLDYAIEALALHLHASFEAFLNDLFLDVLSSQSGLAHVASFVTLTDRSLVREILYGDDDQMEWLPTSRLLARASRFLSLGQPFTRLRYRKLEPIDNLRYVRNRIAHHGEKARETYETRIMRGDESFARPARWLTHTRPGHASDNLMQIIQTVEACATGIATDDPDIDSLLGAAFLIDPGASVPAGTYRCEACGFEANLAAETKLAACGEHEAAAKWKMTGLAEP